MLWRPRYDGVFFDRKYWARHFKAGDVLKPVYFSSVIIGDKSQQLNKGGSKPCRGLVEALNVRSGERDSTGVTRETPGVKNKKEEIRAVLITGSFSAYVDFPTSPLGRNK